MTARKLTESDKISILKLYRETGETTSTLAVRYDVSHSTISRLLKSTLSPDEYEKLIHQKRSGRSHKEAEEDLLQPEQLQLHLPISPVETFEEEESAELPMGLRRRRRRSSVPTESLGEIPETEVLCQSLEFPATPVKANGELREQPYRSEASTLREMLGEELLADLQGELTDVDEDEDDVDEDEDDVDEDEDDEDDLETSDLDDLEATRLITRRPRSTALVQVLPLSQASLPRICYLVVDRSAELITRPLRDFGELGQIPQEEIQERTLPVFDNHRVARRFSNRAQRVIKVPDGRMLQKTCDHLRAKGITRLLIDGQVYSF